MNQDPGLGGSAYDLDDGVLEEFVQVGLKVGLPMVEIERGAVILEEGKVNKELFVILEGEAELFKPDHLGEPVLVDRLGRGSFLGLLSFWTGNLAFSRSVATTAIRCLRISREELDRLSQQAPEFSQKLHPVFIANLCDRYQRLVHLNLTVAGLTRALEHERNDLRQALTDLENARLRLVHKEKLATMGQLLAGIAHEINNPGAALQRGVESLQEGLLGLFSGRGRLAVFSREGRLLEMGAASAQSDTETHRARMERLQKTYPELKRSLARRLAYLEDEAIELLTPLVKRAASTGAAELENELAFYELGALLRTINVSGSRILKLVRSLRGYGRPDSEEWVAIDLSECVRDTVAVLQHRLKDYQLSVDAPSIAPILCSPGEINQVLTNLLVNACDATPKGQGIGVRLINAEDSVSIDVYDTGTGLPPGREAKIFEPNFTTKSAGGGFGLGLGLAISRDIARKHDGALEGRNRPGGGAVFRLRLPRTIEGRAV